MISDMAAWLAARGCGTVDADFFLGSLPAAPWSAAAIQERPGLPPADAFDGTQWEQFRWLVLVRDPSYAAARQRAERFYRALLGIANQQIGANFYQSTAVRPPEQLDVDGNGCDVLGVVVEGCRGLTAL